MAQSTAFQENNFSLGVNEDTLESAIPEGYVEKLENGYPEGTTLIKRKGYELKGGAIPLRVESVVTKSLGPSEGLVYLSISSELNLAVLRNRPIIVYGTLSKDLLPSIFNTITPAGVFASRPSLDPRRVVGAGVSETISLTTSSTSLSHSDILVGVSESLSMSDITNEWVRTSATNVDPSTFTISTTIDNSGGDSSKSFYLYYIDAGADSTYSTYIHTQSVANTTWSFTPSIPNNNLITRCYDASGDEIDPESVVFNTITGLVTITWSEAQAGKCVCIAAEADSFLSGYKLNNYVQSGGATTVTLPAGTATQGWGFVEVYTVSSGVYTKCFPDSYTIYTDGSVVIQFNNQSIDQDDIRLTWAFTGVISRIALSLTTGTVVDGTDDNPQLCIYGISDEETFDYIGANERAGWVTSVDHYKTTTDSTLVATSGWNSFALRTAEEAGALALMPTHTPFLRCRLTSATAYDPILAPALSKTDPGVGQRRSRGLIVSSSVTTDGYATATSLTYDSGYVKLGVPLSALSIVDGNGPTPSQVIDDTLDEVTISQAPYSFLEGSFTIKQHQIDGDVLYLWISVPRVNNSKYDSSNVHIKLGIFSDALEFASPCPFMPEDVLINELLTTEVTVTAVGSRSSGRCIVYVNGITEVFTLSHNLQITANRSEAQVISFRDADNQYVAYTALNIVTGDVVTINGNTRRSVSTAWAQAEESVTVASSPSGALVTIAGINFSTSDLEIGQLIPFVESGEYTGIQVVKEIISLTSFRIEKTGSTSLTAYMQGPAITLESATSISDSIWNVAGISVDERWICIEPPLGFNSSGTIKINPNTKKQFSGTFGLQPIVRSTMVNDTLFMTNGTDPVFKFDGANWMNAGLPRWSPVQFYSNNAKSGIASGNFIGGQFSSGCGAAAYTTGGNTWNAPAYNGNILYFPAAVAATLSVGDKLYVDAAIGTITIGTYLTITAKTAATLTEWNLTAGSGTYSTLMVAVTVNAYASSALTYSATVVGTLKGVGIPYNYYHRIQYIDANNNRISTGVLAFQDARIGVLSEGAVGQKFLNMPKFGIYPYSSFELEVFRTVAGGNTYYRVLNIPLEAQEIDVNGLAQGCNYAQFFDYLPDTVIRQDTDLDPVATSIGGVELPTQVYPPPIAKYITSIGGRLILAATTSTPRIALRFQNGTVFAPTASSLNGLAFTLRKSNTDTSTTTDLTNRVTFVLTNAAAITTSSSVTFTPASAGLPYDTVVTITVGTGLGAKFTTGHWIYIQHAISTSTSLRLSGWYKLADVTGDVLTINTSIYRSGVSWGSGTFDGTISLYGTSATSTSANVPIYIGSDSNFQTVGNLYASVLQIATTRLVLGMNAVAAQEAEAAWYMAEGGFDFASGEVTILFPKALSTTPEFQLPSSINSEYLRVFGNGVVRAQNTAVGAVSRYRGSRICSSYVNYPEMFENPDAEDATRSSYVWDVNPADGQDITSVIPLLGTSTSQGSQLESILIVFKERSIYALNVKGGEAQLLETNGMGCEAPYSVSYIQNGLAFANRAGVFMIERSLKVRPIGDLISRSFDAYGKENLALLQGHHFGTNQQYKLATGDDKVLVASYGTMTEGPNPAWSTYSNHEVRGGWSNFGAYEVFASGSNRVFINRDSGTSEDYRDDSDPITLTIDFRMTAFSDPTIRKQVRHVGVTYRNMDSAAAVVSVYAAVNAKKTYSLLDQSSLSSDDVRKVQTIRYGLPNGRCNYLQLRLVDANLDQPIEVGGIQYRAIGLSQFGTQEAKQTSTSS